MNFSIKNSSFILLLFFATCCKTSTESASIELISKGIFEIPIDEQTSSAWFMVETFELENDEYMVFQDNLRTDPRFLHFANINDSDKSFKVPLEIDGPNGIGHLDGFYVRNLDSIFVLNRYAYELNLVDTSGQLIDRFRLRIGDSNKPALEATLPFLWTFAPIIDLGNKILIPSSPDVDPFKNGYGQKNLAISLDLKTKEFDYVFGFSDKYFNSGFWGIFLETPSYTVNYGDSVILQSFPIEDRVMVYDFDLKLIKSPSLFKDNYMGKFHSLPEFNLDPKIFYPHIYSNPSNKAIVFDPYRNLYYRTFLEAYSTDAIDEMLFSSHKSLRENDGPDKIIQVLDLDFKELGIVTLDKEKYWFEDIQVIREGLIIQVKSENENKNVFEIFEVKY